MKTTVLPKYDDMAERLSSVDNDGYTKERFHPFILEASERELAAAGIVLMLELAIQDWSKQLGLLAGAGNLMRMRIKDYIIALVDDEVVREEALAFLDKTTAEVRKPLDSRPPAPPCVELSDDNKSKLMRRIKQIASIFDNYVDDHGASSRIYRDGGANPRYNQTLDGLFLEFYYGEPSKIWTPWGEWHFAVAQNSYTYLEGFMAHFETRVHIKEHDTEMGTIGPVYAILAIDGEALPEPILPTDKRQYLANETATADWERLFAAN